MIILSGAFHKEFDTDRRPFVLKKALERCEAKGWIVRVSQGGPTHSSEKPVQKGWIDWLSTGCFS
jgi:hypothetical protein